MFTRGCRPQYYGRNIDLQIRTVNMHLYLPCGARGCSECNVFAVQYYCPYYSAIQPHHYLLVAQQNHE